MKRYGICIDLAIRRFLMLQVLFSYLFLGIQVEKTVYTRSGASVTNTKPYESLFKSDDEYLDSNVRRVGGNEPNENMCKSTEAMENFYYYPKRKKAETDIDSEKGKDPKADKTSDENKSKEVGWTEIKPKGSSHPLKLSKEQLGRFSWAVIHSIGASYPLDPTEEDKKNVVAFMDSL